MDIDCVGTFTMCHEAKKYPCVEGKSLESSIQANWRSGLVLKTAAVCVFYPRQYSSVNLLL